MAVIEESQNGLKRTTEARDTHRGIQQGSPCSPLFSNLYFRRFMLAWHQFGYASKYDAKVINYADDYVICTRPGNGVQVMLLMRQLMSKLGLQVNEQKTKLVTLPHGSFDFLGYTFGRFYGKDGKSFIGTKPSKKSVARIFEKIHEATSSRWNTMTVEDRVERLNCMVRGWANYFDQGPVLPVYGKIQNYLNRRLQQWLARKHKLKGRGYHQFPAQDLYEKLKLIRLPCKRAELSRVKT